jgi:hypothetical protein
MEAIKRTFILAVTGLFAALSLSACGGGGGGGGFVPATSTASPVVSQGVVTAKGSVFVNGIEFSTVGASITIDDSPNRPEIELKEGMTVKIRGTSDDATKKGTAIQIEARDALEGQIQAIDNTNHTITVMGQVVRVEDNVTRLNDDNTIKTFAAAGFALNDHVEVHGSADDPIVGGVRATRVAKKTIGLEFESKGFITGLGATSFGLSPTPGGVSALTVNFSAGQIPVGAANGSMVQVKSAAAPASGVITASLIKLEDKLGAVGEKVETEGIVTSGILASFVVNGQQVVTSSATLYEGGLSSDFAVGVKLEAQGPLNASGAIDATKIIFRSNIKIEADASVVSASGLNVLGKSVAIDSFTRVDNGPIVNGSHVEVRASLDRNGNLKASRIIVQSASNKAIFQGPVSAADSAAGTLTILGSTLVSDSATQWRVSSTITDAAVAKASFYAQLKTNISVVKVRWDSFTTLTAPIKEAEIEIGK